MRIGKKIYFTILVEHLKKSKILFCNNLKINLNFL
jgi:hypothetical protein